MLTKILAGWSATAARLTVVSAVAALGVTVEARAADDGQAPLWQGLGSVVGFGKPDDPVIDYREHSKLVLPPKMDLPPPGSSKPTDAAWPTDQNVLRERKLKALKDAPAARYVGKVSSDPISQSGAVITTSATSGVGAGGQTCISNGVAAPCPAEPKAADKPSRQLDWNPLVWVGVQKKSDIVLGPEPGRDFLTDPPPGLRSPAEGVGAKVQNN